MYADVSSGALSSAFHRIQMIKPASARRDHERRVNEARRELGSLGLVRTVWVS